MKKDFITVNSVDRKEKTNTIKFSILGYYPSVVSDQNISVGVLFYNSTADFVSFYILEDWKRLENIDGELDVSFLKLYLKGIQKQCSKYNDSETKFMIEEYIKPYVNKLRFGKVFSF